jgi:branched-chain amino acid transport system ATP-binding protein
VAVGRQRTGEGHGLTATPTMLSASDVTMRFGDFTALDGVSIGLVSGERRALIGPNGAGKTTLFNVISGRLQPSAGEVHYAGQSIAGLSADRICQLGLVRTFQITSIFPRLTCQQNVQAALFARHGHARWLLQRAQRVDAQEALSCLAIVGIESAAGERAANLSYGDQKRLELAIALALKPKVLLLDEPTAGVEAQTRRALARLIMRLCEEQALTLLFCEHDMDAVFSIADRITVLHQGQVLAEGTPNEIQADQRVRSVYLGSGHTIQPRDRIR